MRRFGAWAWVLAAVVACDGPSQPTSLGSTPPAGPEAGTLEVELERQGSRDDLESVQLGITGFAFFFGSPGPAQAEGGRCVVGDHYLELRTSTRIDVRTRGRTPIAAFETDEERPVAEVRLFTPGATALRRGRAHPVHGDGTCTGPDGATYLVLFLRPEQETRVAHRERVKLVIVFDARDELLTDHVTCATTTSGGGGTGGGGTGGTDPGGAGTTTTGDRGGPGGDGAGGTDPGGAGTTAGPGTGTVDPGGASSVDPVAAGTGAGASTTALHAPGDPPECHATDDADDDGDGRTRLRFSLDGELPFRPERGQGP
jgi:hypothetical protein